MATTSPSAAHLFPPAASRRLSSCWLAIVLFAVGMLNLPLRLIGWDGDGLPGDGIDNVLNNYMLEHGYQSLRGRASFWHAPIFYPTPGMTGTTGPHIALMPFYSLLRVLGLSPERAFQGWFILAFVLNYVSALWAARRLGFDPAPAAVAAFIFAFALPVTSQVSHAQLLHRWLVPPAVVLAWQFLGEPTHRRFALLTTCWFGQFLLTAYIAIFLAELLLVFLVLTGLRLYRNLPWSELFPLRVGVWLTRLLIILAILMAVGGIVLRHARVSGVMDREYLILWAPEPLSWLACHPTAVWNAVAPALGLDLGNVHGERRLFPGWVPLLAMLFALGQIRRSTETAEGRRKVVVSLLCWSSLLLAIWITRFGQVWLYEPILSLPGGSTIRVVGRIVLVLLFPLGLASAELFTWVLSRSHYLARIGGIFLLLVLMAEHAVLPTTWVQQWEGQRVSLGQLVRWQERLEQAIRQHPQPRLVYVFPSELPPAPELDHQYYRLQVVVMRAAQNVGIPCVNGYSGYNPADWDIFTSYRELFHWLTKARRVPAGHLRGLVLIGEPEPDVDPEYEGIMRQTYPPLPLPPWD